MNLFEHPDFEQAILGAAEHFSARGLRASMIEKDYYVTEALRALATAAGDKIIFKGGTSLSKGWNLIERFSEDIDIFLDPQAFDPPLGKHAIDRELKKLRRAVERHPALTFIKPDKPTTIGGFGRTDAFSYKQKFGGPGELVNRILVEAGTASGREPTAQVELRSYISQFFADTNQTLGTADEVPFTMRLLHFRRTFVEKIFTIHSRVELYKRTGERLGRRARDYYDVYQLAGQSEVAAMLASDEYAQIKADHDRISKTHFPGKHFPPESMSFADSDALFPAGELLDFIREDYERQCRDLCFGPSPSWNDVQSRLLTLRSLL